MVTHIPSPTHSTTSLNYSSLPVHPSNPSAYLYSSNALSSSSSRRRPSESGSSRSSTSSRTATTSNPPSSYKPSLSRHRSSSRSSTRSSSSTLRPSDSQSTANSVAPSQADSHAHRLSSHHHSKSAQSDAGRPISKARTSQDRSHNSRNSSATTYTPSRSRETCPEQQNIFPYFSQTGDVEIVIADRRKRRSQVYLLHSMFLAQNSAWWAQQLQDSTNQEYHRNTGVSSIPGAVTTARGSATDRGRRRYELYWGDATEEHSNTIPVLVRSREQRDPLLDEGENHYQPPQALNKPVTSSSSFFRGIGTAKQVSALAQTQVSTYELDIMEAYDNLLRIIYNHSPNLDSTNPATAYVQSKHLLALASTYSCLSITGPRIEHHLLHFRSLLPQQIAKYPPSYLKLAYQAHSRTILNDAIVHVVGSWPLHAPQLARGDIPNRLRDLIEDKSDELEEAKARVEAKLFRLTLTTSRGERVNPSNSWLDWLAVSLFRQWVAENTTPAPPGILKSSNASSSGKSGRSSSQQSQQNTDRTYRLLASSSSSAYLGHDELKRFLKMSQPASLYTRDNLRRFERRIEELKNLAREAVRPLMRSFLELDHGRDTPPTPPYLTCTRMGEGDWEFLWGST